MRSPLRAAPAPSGSCPGFGKVSEQKILKAIEERRTRGTREIHIDAEEQREVARTVSARHPTVTRVEIAGQVRRWCEIVDHLALVVETAQRDACRSALELRSRHLGRPTAPRSSRHGSPTACAARSTSPRTVAFRLGVDRRDRLARARVGSSKRARQREASCSTLDAPDEVDVYRALGLPFLPPEVRDGTDELAAADAGDDFTDLVTLADVTTAFHCHTTYSDGKDSIATRWRAPRPRSAWRAITITDHSAAASYAGGLDAEALRKQHAEMARLRDSPVRLLRGTEADILADGSIDVPLEIVPELDLVIASVHQRYKADEDADDEAARHRRCASRSSRCGGTRSAGSCSAAIRSRCGSTKCSTRSPSHLPPSRSTAIRIVSISTPIHARQAAARGIPFVLSSDAHSVRGIESVRWAVAMARRARIRKRQVLNALPPDQLAERIRPLA